MLARPENLVSFHSQKEFCTHLWITVGHVELDDKFNFSNDIVSTVSCKEIFFEQTVPSFKDLQTPHQP